MAKLGVDVGRQQAGKILVVQVADFGFDNITAMRTVGFKQFDLFQLAVVHAPIIAVDSHRPVHRTGADAEYLLQFIHQLERIPAEAVDFVDKGEDRDMALPANLEQFPGLLLHALGRVDQHHGAVGRHQRPVGVLAEILVAGRVQYIDATAAVFELHDAGRHRNPALLFDLHPVRHRKFLRFSSLDGPGQMNGAAVQQQLFRQCSLAGVRMRNDRESPPFINLFQKVRVLHARPPLLTHIL